jgi:signal transduction histidine kinase
MSTDFDLTKDNVSFKRNFNRYFKMLLCIVALYIIITTFTILRSRPTYMHDWHGPACIVLSLVLFVGYAAPILIPRRIWPLPLYYTLSTWLIMYFVTILLTLMDTNFLLDFYIVFGISLALFQARYLVVIVTIIAFTMFAFQGLLTWPLSEDALPGIMGQLLALFSMTAFGILMQHLISERYERNSILLQLTQANSELEQAHRKLTQSVEQEQELAVLRERTRLAREMHDTLGHALVLISVKLEAAQRLRKRDPERCERELESTKEVARESMTALRASIANLRTPALEREHIYRALSRSTSELAHRTGLHVTYTLQADIERLPEPVEETLWKVWQEALTNIEKHAHASYVELRIMRQEETLLMSIHDDGIGLPQDLCQAHENGSLTFPNDRYGLRGMLERVEGLGGHLSLDSAKGQGTTINIDLPLRLTDLTPQNSSNPLSPRRDDMSK